MRFVLAATLAALLIAPARAQTVAPSSAPTSAPSTVAPSPASTTAPSPAATTISEFARARVDAMLRSGRADAAWFSATFLAQVSTAQIDAIIAQIASSLGAYKDTDGTQGDYTAHFEKGTDEVIVHLDADSKIDGLFFKPPKLQASSLNGALHALQPATGTLSYVLYEGRSERAALNASAPLAVGSAFKLAVLAALRDEIANGSRRWTDVIPLDASRKSIPSGVLQTWPDHTPITLATYAAEMISISDNTAADTLVRLTSPDALRAYAKRNTPFLTTRELAILKSTSGAALRPAYLNASTPAARDAALSAVDSLPNPPVATLEAQPILAIEWHYSVRELCTFMNRVADLPLMSINPGAADAASFQSVAFKGGSDTGVINLTTHVTTRHGSSFCFSATLNNSSRAVEDHVFTAAYGSVLNVLATR